MNIDFIYVPFARGAAERILHVPRKFGLPSPFNAVYAATESGTFSLLEGKKRVHASSLLTVSIDLRCLTRAGLLSTRMTFYFLTVALTEWDIKDKRIGRKRFRKKYHIRFS